MWAHLERGSSPVDWCEANYSISPVIAEFVNTITNVIFFLYPPVLIHLFQEYSRHVNRGINVLWILLMIVGLCSAYFHATLSLVGQLLDELAILWLYMGAFSMFCPKRYFPMFLNGSRERLYMYSLIFSIISTCFLIMHPAANAFALMTLAIPAVASIYESLQRVKCDRVYRLGVRCATVCGLAICSWTMDRMFCDTWLNINFPYLHGVWHILIGIGSFTSVVLFAYLTVIDECPESNPVLKYWPNNDFELGVPFVSIKQPYRLNKKLDI